jgi:thiol:disulfide interchange protein
MELDFITQTDFENLDKKGHIVINALADWCTACGEYKKDIPELKELAETNYVKMFNMKVDPINESFFEKYKCETLPYTFVFANGEFVGGDSFNKDSASQLLMALGGVIPE